MWSLALKYWPTKGENTAQATHNLNPCHQAQDSIQRTILNCFNTLALAISVTTFIYGDIFGWKPTAAMIMNYTNIPDKKNIDSCTAKKSVQLLLLSCPSSFRLGLGLLLLPSHLTTLAAYSLTQAFLHIYIKEETTNVKKADLGQFKQGKGNGFQMGRCVWC